MELAGKEGHGAGAIAAQLLASASNSSFGRAAVDGTGRSAMSRWVGAADDDSPAAPAARASAGASRTIAAISSSVAARCVHCFPHHPPAQVGMADVAGEIHTQPALRLSRNSAKVSHSFQVTPLSAIGSMFSTAAKIAAR